MRVRVHVLIRMVNTPDLPPGHVLHEELLPLLIRQRSSDVVPVKLGLEHRDEVDSGPHFLAGELAAQC